MLLCPKVLRSIVFVKKNKEIETVARLQNALLGEHLWPAAKWWQ